MDLLSEIRGAAGGRITEGLPDVWISKFLVQDSSLGVAISNAYQQWTKLRDEDGGKSTYKRSEQDVIDDIAFGWCNLYPTDTRNPYIPLAAKGPWIVTTHGAVLHDNGGYGMLGFGHSPSKVIDAMAADEVMANIMTPALAQKKFIEALRKEIGHNRPGKICPYEAFLLMNSGSEGNSVADRLIDINTGSVMRKKDDNGFKTVKCIAMKGAFHGRTYKPALWTDACRQRYETAGAYSIIELRKEISDLTES